MFLFLHVDSRIFAITKYLVDSAIVYGEPSRVRSRGKEDEGIAWWLYSMCVTNLMLGTTIDKGILRNMVTNADKHSTMMMNMMMILIMMMMMMMMMMMVDDDDDDDDDGKDVQLSGAHMIFVTTRCNSIMTSLGRETMSSHQAINATG